MNKFAIEEVALDLMISIMQTRKAAPVLERAISFALKKGDKKIVPMLAASLEYIESEGDSPLDAFNFAGMLQPDTYDNLKTIEESGSLSVETLSGFLEDKRNYQKMKKGMLGSLFLPVLLVTMSSLAGGFLISQFTPLLESTTPDWAKANFEYVMYHWIGEHPLLGGVILASVLSSAAIVFSLIIMDKVASKSINLYSLTSSIYIMRASNLPYYIIFEKVAQRIRDKEMNEVAVRLAEEARHENIIDIIEQIAVFYPLSDGVVLMDKISSREDVSGWEVMREKMKVVAETKVKTLSETLPTASYLFILIALFFSMYPAGVSIMALLNKV